MQPVRKTLEEKVWDDASLKWETSALTTGIFHNLGARSPWRTLKGSFCSLIKVHMLACLQKWADSAALCWLN